MRPLFLLSLTLTVGCTSPRRTARDLPTPEAGLDDNALTSAVAASYHKALALATRQGAPPQALCLTRRGLWSDEPEKVMRADVSESVLAALRATGLDAHSIGECQVSAYWAQASLRQGNRLAWILWVDTLADSGEHLTASIGYHLGGLAGAGYSCRLTSTSTGWTLDPCVLVSVE
jgi:hypothetical protein